MDIYRTEEEQIVAIQSWWKRRGPWVVAIIAIALVFFVGWRLISGQSVKSSEAAFAQFDRVLEAVNQASVEDLNEDEAKVFDTTVITESEVLFETYPKQTYAHLGALLVAKHHVDAGRWHQAREVLSWSIAQKPTHALRVLTKARLAQIHLQLAEYDQALAVLDSESDLTSFEGLYEALRGDIYVQQGDLSAARSAYEKALLAVKGADSTLKMKLDDLAEDDSIDAKS